MHRAWLALAVLLCATARGQAPSYSAAGIVNAANYAPGPFAANSVVTIFGSNLSDTPSGVSATEVAGGTLPTNAGLAGVRVIVNGITAPLLYVSATQINFLIPAELLPGTFPVFVAKQGLRGPPDVNITLVPGAPALFSGADGYVIAEDWNAGYAIITTAAPAHAGDVVILYATGLGAAGYDTTGQVPASATPIDNLASLNVYVNGVALDRSAILYAGLTPGFAGLYQINLVLPPNPGADPEIRVAIGNQESPPGSKLAVH